MVRSSRSAPAPEPSLRLFVGRSTTGTGAAAFPAGRRAPAGWASAWTWVGPSTSCTPWRGRRDGHSQGQVHRPLQRDPDSYGLPRNVGIKLNDKDVGRAKELLMYRWSQKKD